MKGRNASGTALRWFASDTAHIVFMHIPSMVKPVHIVMGRNRVFKSCLMASLLKCVPCVLKTCSRANVPYLLTCSHANVLCVLTCSRANVSCVLIYSRADVFCVLTCQRALRAHVPTCLACLRAHVSRCLACLRAHALTLLAWLRTCVTVSKRLYIIIYIYNHM